MSSSEVIFSISPEMFIIGSVIIFSGSLLTAILSIFNFFKKPAQKYKEKHDTDTKKLISEVLTETLPAMLKKHDLETRDRYRADREAYLNEIRNSVLAETQHDLEQISILKMQYESLVISARDVLREKIIKIYLDNHMEKRIPILEKERLVQFYKDYKALNGNSYIDKYYGRMTKWQVIYDDDYDNEEQ